jgi:hypothetical protein
VASFRQAIAGNDVAKGIEASIALKQLYYRLVDRLVDGPDSCPEFAQSSDLFLLGKFVRLAEPSVELLVGERVAPPGTAPAQWREIGRKFLEGLRKKSVTDHGYPVGPVLEVLRELIGWWGELSVLGELSDALKHHRIGCKVPLLAPVEFAARPPEGVYHKCIYQAEILACRRFREVRYGKGGLVRARNEVAKIAGYHPDTIRDWESLVRRVLPFGELDALLAGAERLALEVNRATGREAQKLMREAEALYGDKSILESKCKLLTLLKASKCRRMRGTRAAKAGLRSRATRPRA